MEDGSKAEYKPSEVQDGTVDRDNQRKANEEKYGCYMTDAQIERGDCDIIEEDEEQYDTEEEFYEDDDMVLYQESEDQVEDLITDDVRRGHAPVRRAPTESEAGLVPPMRRRAVHAGAATTTWASSPSPASPPWVA